MVRLARAAPVGVVALGLRLTAAGAAIGLAGAVAAGAGIRTILYGVGPTDPATLAGVSLTLFAVAAIATWIPARRAARVDPIETLRAD